MTQFTDEEKAAEANRETDMRRRVYARQVERESMRADDAARKIAIMAEIADDYARLVQGSLFDHAEG